MTDATKDRSRPETEEDLLAYIHEVCSAYRGDGFGTEARMILGRDVKEEDRTAYDLGPEVMWRCALAAFEYAAHVVNASGLQASFAELEFLKHSRNLRGPFAVIDGEDMLYPQYDIPTKVQGYLRDWRGWAREEAVKLLASDRGVDRVRRHWQDLVDGIL